MGSQCIECGSTDTAFERGGDGHFRKECGSCGHTGGPYTSNQTGGGGDGDDGQATLGDYS